MYVFRFGLCVHAKLATNFEIYNEMRKKEEEKNYKTCTSKGLMCIQKAFYRENICVIGKKFVPLHPV
jgi:hypothetical protein